MFRNRARIKSRRTHVIEDDGSRAPEGNKRKHGGCGDQNSRQAWLLPPGRRLWRALRGHFRLELDSPRRRWRCGNTFPCRCEQHSLAARFVKPRELLVLTAPPT